MAEKKINESTYQVGVILATDALLLKTRLLKIVGNGAKELPAILRGRGDKASKEAQEKSDAAATKALTDIFEAIEPEQYVKLISDIVGFAQVQRPSSQWERCDLDGQFTQNKADLYPVVLFVLKEAFSDFFSGLEGVGNLVSKIPKV